LPQRTPIRRGSREARSINQLSHQREPHGRRIRPIPALVSAQPVKTFATSWTKAKANAPAAAPEITGADT